MTSRVPFRVGAELFGHAGVECDIELICLMEETLAKAGVDEIYIVLGHVGIFRTLVQEAGLGFKAERDLFLAAQRKAYDEIDEIVYAHVKDEKYREMLRRLTWLNGDESTLDEAVSLFADGPATVKAELDELITIANSVKQRKPDINLHFDLCELRGYEYHTGIVFAAYAPGYGRAVAKGGRYDDIGEAFGRARPASGFDSDLKVLARLSAKSIARKQAILAPNGTCPLLLAKIAELRGAGETVIVNLQSSLTLDEIEELACDRQLLQIDDQWSVQPL